MQKLNSPVFFHYLCHCIETFGLMSNVQVARMYNSNVAVTVVIIFLGLLEIWPSGLPPVSFIDMSSKY